MKFPVSFQWLMPFDYFEPPLGSVSEKRKIWLRNQQKQFWFYRAAVVWMWLGASMGYWAHVFWGQNALLGFSFLICACFFGSFGGLWLMIFLRLFFAPPMSPKS